MKVVVKRLVGDQWEAINIDEYLVGKSLCMIMMESKDTMVAALYQDNEPVAFVSNRQEYVDIYKAKGLSMSCSDVQQLIGTEVAPALIVQELAGSKLVSINTVDSEQDPK